jgi:2-C-methyl-D-erythritol 4-phosphate cytidylyltransferase
MNSIAVIICAAGASARMGGIKKEYRPLPGADEGLTVLGKAVSVFAEIPEIKAIVITVPGNVKEERILPRSFTEEEKETNIAPCCPTGLPSSVSSVVNYSSESAEAAARNALPSRFIDEKSRPAVYFVSGGATRQASVFNALSFLASQCAPDMVLIHDGARPWVSPALIRRVIAGVEKYRAVIPLLPLTETPKEINAPLEDEGDGVAVGSDPVFIKKHLRRTLVGVAQTPQGFAFPEILTAHQQAARHDSQIEYTDDAEVWAAFCGPVAAIPGESENRKITFPEDLYETSFHIRL